MNLTVLQKYDDIDRNVSDMVITLFTNFAKYGNPTPQPVRGVSWEEFNSSRKAYLRIHSVPEMAINFQPTRMAFWNGYYENMLKEEPKTCKSQSGESDVISLDLFCFVCGLCLFPISFGYIWIFLEKPWSIRTSPTTVTFRTDSDLLLQRGDRYGKEYPGYQTFFFLSWGGMIHLTATGNRAWKPSGTLGRKCREVLLTPVV